MSGGSYDYAYRHVEDVAVHPYLTKTALRRAFARHLKLVAKAMHAVEWVDSSDWGRGDEDEAIRAVLAPGAELEEARAEAERACAELRRLLDETK